jgi:hypothetical protein
MKTVIYRGKIGRFSGNWMSGIGYLIIGGKMVPCDNAPTVRALDACFGNVITNWHSVNNDAIHGKDIVYSMDEYGMILEAFTPTKDWRKIYGSKFTPRINDELVIETQDLQKRESDGEDAKNPSEHLEAVTRGLTVEPCRVQPVIVYYSPNETRREESDKG